MMIIAIAASTMIVVAMVVFAVQYYAYRKNHPKQNTECTRKGSAVEAPIAS